MVGRGVEVRHDAGALDQHVADASDERSVGCDGSGNEAGFFRNSAEENVVAEVHERQLARAADVQPEEAILDEVRVNCVLSLGQP